MMAAVRNKDSKAELALRKALHATGIRYRLHSRDVLGRPDIVIRKYRVAIFVDGDFWHGNAWRLRKLAALSELFPNRAGWWTAKIERNMERDREVTDGLEAGGWTVVRIWESDIALFPQRATSKAVRAIHRARMRTA
jgi:DNA mismatch endonuclease (patch repair protein)